MNRMIRGMAGLLVALGASACGDDPSVDFGGDSPTKIQASPEVMFVNQGESEQLIVRLVDDRNRATPTSFEISNVGAGITVALDRTFRPDYIGSDQLEFKEIQYAHRLIVSAVDPVGTTFTVSSGGISQVIQVKVVPTVIPITFGTVANGTVTVTSTNFTFDEGTHFDFGNGIVQTPLALADGGHTATIAAAGGLANVIPEISGARASYMPTVALAAADGSAGLSTGASFGGLTFGAATEFTLSYEDMTFSDAGSTWGPDAIGGGGPMLWYKFVVPADRHLDITVDWSGANDLDWWLADAGLNQLIYQGTSAHPEHNSGDVTAGTYYLGVIDYATGGAPTSWTIHIGP